MNLSKPSPALAEARLPVARDATQWLAWLQARLGRLDAAWADRRKRAREVRDLYRLSDRELWDVGLSRSDLPAIARGMYRRD